MQMGISILIPIFITPYILNGLGKDQYGLWVLLNSIIIYFSLSSFGFTTTMLREISSCLNNHEKISKIVSVTFYSFVVFSLLVFLFFILIYLNFDALFKIDDNLVEMAKGVFFITFLIFIFSFFASIYDNILFASNKLYIKNLLDIAKNILIAISSVLVVYLEYTIYEIALASFFITLLYLICVVLFSRKGVFYTISWDNFDLNIFKNMIRPSLHYFILSIAGLIIFNSDNIIIGAFISLSAVAVYSIGYKVVDTVQKLIFKIVDIFMPNIAVLYEKKEYETILKFHNKLMVISILFSIPIYLLLYFLNQWLLTLWVGSENVIEQEIMTIFILFSFVHVWVHVSAVFVAALGIHRETSYIALVEAFLNILLSIIFAEFYGLMGIALGTLIAHLLTSAWFVNFWFYKNINRCIRNDKL
jgi:O-antigen/teichoic acid export membrane protein